MELTKSEVKVFRTDKVQQCLTNSCTDCTKFYINRIFGHRLICECSCHKITKEKTLDVDIPLATSNISNQTASRKVIPRR